LLQLLLLWRQQHVEVVGFAGAAVHWQWQQQERQLLVLQCHLHQQQQQRRQ
jgi:hypothetical protein